MTGRVPSADELQQAAARASQATLAWPAPADRDEAIDALEHDLATLRALVDEPDHRARGRAHYILQLNDCLQRSVRERFMRGKKPWSHWDGITAATDRIRPILARSGSARAATRCRRCRSTPCARTSSCSSAIYRMRPADDLEPLQRMDPLTRGSLFHAVQTAFYRRLQARGRAAGRRRPAAIARSRCSTQRSRQIAGRASTSCSRRRSIASGTTRSAPSGATCACGSTRSRAPAANGSRSRSSGRSATATAARWPSAATRRASAEPVTHRRPVSAARIDRSRRGARGDRRAARHRSQDRAVPRQGPHDRRRRRDAAAGAVLARARGRRPGVRCVEGRLYYATTAGGYRDVRIPLTPQARRTGVEVLEIIDRGVETGFLAPAPREKACTWCDFRPVCGTDGRAARQPLQGAGAARRSARAAEEAMSGRPVASPIRPTAASSATGSTTRSSSKPRPAPARPPSSCARILNVLARGRARIEQIVAVTFTEKAAGELKLRIRKELESLRQRASDAGRAGEPHRRDPAARRSARQHDSRLLRRPAARAAGRSGVDPLFEVLTEPRAERIFDEAFRGVAARAAGASAGRRAPGAAAQRLVARRPRQRRRTGRPDSPGRPRARRVARFRRRVAPRPVRSRRRARSACWRACTSSRR